MRSYARACGISAVALLAAVVLLVLPGSALAAPVNDDFANAINLVGDDPYAVALVAGSTGEANEPLSSNNTNTVWYTWTPVTDHVVLLGNVLDRQPRNASTWVKLFTGASVGGLTPVPALSSSFDARHMSEYLKGRLFRVQAGQQYRVQVTGEGPSGAPYRSHASVMVPTINLFADAFAAAPIGQLASTWDVGGSASTAYGIIDGAGREAGEPVHAGVAGGSRTIWRRVTTQRDATVTFSTEGSEFDTVLGVYTGSSVGSLTPVASNDNASGSVTHSEVTVAMQAHVVYRVAVSDTGSGTGLAVLKASMPGGSAVNDEYATRSTYDLVGAWDWDSGFNSSGYPGPTLEPGEPATIGGATDTAWWTITTPRSGRMSVTFEHYSGVGNCAGTDFNVEMFTGNSLGTLTLVATRLAGSPYYLDFNATAGTPYTFRVSGVTMPPTCSFIRVGMDYATFSVLPDAFASALDISAEAGAGTFDEYVGPGLATTEPGEPTYGDGTDRSLWYKFTSTSNRDYSFRIGGYGQTSLHAFTGASIGTLVPVASSVGPPYDGTGWPETSLTFSATSGTTYYLMVGGVGGGAYANLESLPAAAPNDMFALASVLGPGPAATSGSATVATREPGEPAHTGAATPVKSVWYTWTTPVDRRVKVDLAGSSYTGSLAVYTGSAVNALTLVGRDDGTGAGTNQVVFDAVAGTTYRIAVSASQFLLNVDGSATHDKFAASSTLAGANGRVTGSNFGASRQLGEPSHAGNATGGSMWYSWTAAANGFISFDTSGSSVDTVLAVYTGNSVEDLVGVSNNDNAVAGATYSRVTIPTVSGRTYRIAVEGASNARGNFVLRWRAPEQHDLQTSPTVLPATGGSSASSLLGAGTEHLEPSQCPVTSCDATVWYSWTPSFSGIAGIRTTGASFDTVLAAYTGAPGSLALVSANDDNGSATTSRLRFVVTSGTTYRIQVASKNGSVGAGSFTLEANVAPANDSFASSTLLSGPTVVWSGHNFDATSEVGEPVHAGIAGGKSIWLRWVATSTGTMTLDTQGSEIDTLLGVYTGGSVSTLTTIASDDNSIAPASRLTFAATSGTTYYFAVDGKAADQGEVVVRLNVPTNDNVAGATPITDSGFVPIAASTIGATREIGEPDFSWFGGGPNTIWYQWTITTEATRILTVSNNSVAIEVFGSPAFATLQPVATFGQYGSGTYRGRLTPGTYWVRASSSGHDFTFASPTPPPANDDLAAAQVITGAGPWAGDDSNAAGEAIDLELGFRVSLADWRIPSTWFSWTAPSTGMTAFRVSGDRKLSVWRDTGSDRGNMLRVDLTGSNDSTRTFLAQAGQTYLLRAAAATAGAYTLTLDPRPGNDDFANSTLLGDPTANRAASDNTGGSCEAGEPAHAGAACDASVWYRWTPSSSGTARFTTVGSRIDTTVAVYTGAAVNSLIPVASNAGPHPAFSKGAQLDTAVTSGTTYYIAVSARSGQRGEVHIQAAMAVPGDDIASPIILAGDSGTVSGTTAGATVENTSIDAMGSSGAGWSGTVGPDPLELSTVWIRWIPSYTGIARVTPSMGFDGSFDVYEGATPGRYINSWPSTKYGDLANIPTSIAAPAGLSVTAGQTYWFRFADRCCYSSYWGSYSLSVNLTPNDAFASATTFPGSASRLVELAMAGSTEGGEPNHGGAGDPRTFWWNWTAPSNATVSFTTAGSGADTSIGAYTGATVGALTLVAQANDTNGDDARIQFAATSGTTYRIAVGASGAAFDSIVLRRNVPTNDEATAADLVAGSVISTPISVANGAYDPQERTKLGATAAAPSVWTKSYVNHAVGWHKWVAPSNLTTDVSVTGGYDVLRVFVGANPATMTRLDIQQVSIPNGTKVRFDPVAGQTYHFATGVAYTWSSPYGQSSLSDGIDPGEGDATFSLVQRPVNDDFANATALAGWSSTTTVDTTLATRQVGEPIHSDVGEKSVWYTWTAPSSGPASISTVGSSFDTLIGLYTGATLGGLTPVATRDDYPSSTRAVVTFTAVAGTTYRIAIDGYRTSSGTATVGVNVRPPNDDFANAFTIDGDIARVTGYSTNSTTEGGEPSHSGLGTDSSVWWTWTAPTSGPVTIDTFGSDFNTVLGVYTGGAVGSLAAVASNDDAGAGQQSSVTFAAVAATTYRIAVAGVSSVGNVRVRVNARQPLPPDLVSPIGGATSASRTGPFRARVHHQDVAVLAGVQVEVCAGGAAPADPWSVNCASGYQVTTGPALVSDGATQDVSVASRLTMNTTYSWRARTVDDAGQFSAWSASTTFVVGSTVSSAVSTLGLSDTARDMGGVSFGTLLPTFTQAIGPVGSGQRIAGAAVILTTTSDYGTNVSVASTDFLRGGGGGTIPAGALQWRDNNVAGQVMQQAAWTSMTNAGVASESGSTDVNAYGYDLRITPPAATPSGSYTGTVTFTTVAAP